MPRMLVIQALSLLALIHRCTWNRDSANIVIYIFSEVPQKDAEQAETVRLADLAPLRLVVENYVGQHPELRNLAVF